MTGGLEKLTEGMSLLRVDLQKGPAQRPRRANRPNAPVLKQKKGWMYNDVSVMYIPFSSPSKKYIGYPMGTFWDARTTANRLFRETHRWNHRATVGANILIGWPGA